MNPFFQNLINEQARKTLQSKKSNKLLTPKMIKDTARIIRIEWTHLLHDYLFIALGVLSASFGLGGFLLPNQFIDGGVTGISLLAEVVTGVPLSILLVLINLPFIVLGYRTIGPGFAWRSIIGIVLLAIAVHLAHFPTITDDKLLIAVFGGFFLGMGIGLAVRGGAVIDGTEVLAIFISRRTSLSIGDLILIFNIIIFGFAAYILSIETALYAILTYMTASKTVDFVVDGVEEYVGVTIVSHHSEKIREAITERLGRGCTIYQGKRGYSIEGETRATTEIVFTVVTRLELARLHTEIDKIDEKAFVVMGAIKDTKGGMVKKRPLNKMKKG